MIRRMPVPGRKYGQAVALELRGVAVDPRQDGIAARNGERATRQKIPLYIYHYEGIALVGHHGFGVHGASSS
jgi:hypothetical protein